MTIKRRQALCMNMIAYILCSSTCTILFSTFELPIVIIILILMPIYLFSFTDLLSIGRTFILDETGCTVCMWKYRKKYTWEQLNTKIVIKYYIPSMYSNSLYPSYETEIFFAPYKMHKPRMIRACIYRAFHPIRCIYIYFTPKNAEEYYLRDYEVDEQEFRTKMAQWGVEFIET